MKQKLDEDCTRDGHQYELCFGPGRTVKDDMERNNITSIVQSSIGQFLAEIFKSSRGDRGFCCFCNSWCLKDSGLSFWAFNE